MEHAYNNVLEYFSEEVDVNDGSDAELVFRRKKRFASFGIDIHGEGTEGAEEEGKLLGAIAKSDDPSFSA